MHYSHTSIVTLSLLQMKKSLLMIRKRSHHWMIMMLFLFLGINVGYAANEKLPSIGTVETNVNSNAGITEDRSWTIQGQVFEQSELTFWQE